MLTFFGIMFEQTNQSEQFGGFLRIFVVFVFPTLDTFHITVISWQHNYFYIDTCIDVYYY